MNRLKELREEAGLSARKLGSLTGVDHSVIGFLETGRRKFREVHISLLTRFFGVTSDYLLGFSDYGLEVLFTDDEEDTSGYILGSEYQQLKEKRLVELEIYQGIPDWKDKEAKVEAGNVEIDLFYSGPHVTRFVNAKRSDLSGMLKDSTSLELMDEIKTLDTDQQRKVLKFIRDYIKEG